MALINHSDKWYYKTANGYVEGDQTAPAEAVSVLVCPGGSIDEGLAEQVGLADVLAAHSKAPHVNPVTGEELVMRGDRAYAKQAFEPKNPDGSPVQRKSVVPGGREADHTIENKAVVAPAVKSSDTVKPSTQPTKPTDKV